MNEVALSVASVKSLTRDRFTLWRMESVDGRAMLSDIMLSPQNEVFVDDGWAVNADQPASFLSSDWLLANAQIEPIEVHEQLMQSAILMIEVSLGGIHSYGEMSLQILSVKKQEITDSGVNNYFVVSQFSDAKKSVLSLGNLESGRE